MEFKKKVLVAGAGRSGLSAVKLLTAVKADVILYDSNKGLDPEELKKLAGTEELLVLTGELKEEDIKDVELCVISPGIDLGVPFVQLLKRQGIKIWSEVELAWRFAKGKLAAITGTNGKTTTTALTGQILKNWYPQAFTVGNIGVAYTEKALCTTEDSATALEVSSFQLETIDQFRPDVSAILNITEDHLNRHKTMENYTAVKESITKNQRTSDVCVLNYEDEELRRFGAGLDVGVLYFSSRRNLGCEPELGEKNSTRIYLEYREGRPALLCWEEGRETLVCYTDELNIIGTHNYENAMAAVGISLAMGVPLSVIAQTMKEFKAVEHRIEFVAEKNGVAYYNDSKGTNPDAAIKAVEAMTRPTVLIAGGYDKDSCYDTWIGTFKGKITCMILLGQTADKIEAAARRQGFTSCVRVSSMEEAVACAAARALPGEAVLLSPACASWGMFKNYEERGRIFKELVLRL